MAHPTLDRTEKLEPAASFMEVAAPAVVPASEAGEEAQETMHEMIAADGTSTETAHAEAAPGLPQLNFATYPSQIFWLALLFTALYVVMQRAMLPRIQNVLENRANRIQQDLDRAEYYQQQAADARATFERTQAEARAHVQGVMDAVQKKAKDKAAIAAQEIDSSMRSQMAEAEAAITAARTKALTSAPAAAESLAQAIATRIMQPNDAAAPKARRA